MCWPTDCALAFTVVKAEHVKFEHTLRLRRLPTMGGPAAADAIGALAAGAIPTCGELRVRPISGRKRSTASALERRVPALRRATCGVALVARGVGDVRAQGAEAP